MGYEEQFQVNAPVGLHNAILDGLLKVPVKINGVAVNAQTAEHLYGLGRGGVPITVGAETGNPQLDRDIVHLAQGIINVERNLWPGNQGQLPPEHTNMWANFARSAPKFGLNIPQEGPNQIPEEKLQQFSQKFLAKADHEKREDREPVNGEMTAAVTSKWHVLALGEQQLPGGVGATDYNPVLDGENPLDPPSADSAQNSIEQDVALETWVNYAVDMLNRGETAEAVLAKLAHDGCPNPEDILARAQEQPLDQSPVSDEIGQDPFEAPPAADAPSGQMESVSQQPPVLGSVKEADVWAEQGEAASGGLPKPGDAVLFRPDNEVLIVTTVHGGQIVFEKKDGTPGGSVSTDDYLAMWGEGTFADAGPGADDPLPGPVRPGISDAAGNTLPHATWSKVRIANTSLTGKIIDRYEDTWGQGLVMVALDDGGTMTVSPDAVEEVDAESAPHPVSQIQEFIDSMEPVQPTRPHIEARIANLKVVRQACRAAVGQLGFSDQVKVASMDSDAQAEIASLEQFLGAVASKSDVAYLSGLQTYRTHGLDLPDVKRVSVQGTFAAEQPAIFVAELDEAVARDAEATAYAAARYARDNNLNIPEFVAAAEDHRTVRTEEFTPVERTTEEPEIDAEGPAEQLFV